MLNGKLFLNENESESKPAELKRHLLYDLPKRMNVNRVPLLLINRSFVRHI